MDMDTVKLNCGMDMPIIGYGVYLVDPSVTERCVMDALSVGYRSLDTAQYYENEAMVGAAVRKSGIPRNEIFITSKLCLSRPSYQRAKENVKGSLQRMRLDYLDLMLIHWPMGNDGEIWPAFEDLVKEGCLRSIGVSNFYPEQFDRLVRNASHHQGGRHGPPRQIREDRPRHRHLSGNPQCLAYDFQEKEEDKSLQGGQ